MNKLIYYGKKLLFLVLAGIFVYTYYAQSRNVSQSRALIYPNFLLIFTTAVIVWNVIGTFFEAGKEIAQGKAEELLTIPQLFKKHQKEIVVFLSLIVFMLAIQRIGFWVTTFAYILSLSYFLGLRKPLGLIPLAVCATGSFYLLFGVLLRLNLPRGMFF